MSLPITITTAGLNALINAQNTGGSGVVIAQIGVSPTQIAVTPATVAIPDEIKRLGGVAGLVVADDTIHVSAADQSADTYTVRTVALYLDTGVLFAAYSQAGVLFEKASAAMIVLDADVQLSTALAEVIEFTGGGWTNPPATESVPGVVRIATDAEVTAGVNDTRAVTPKKLATRLASLVAGISASFDAVYLALSGKAATDHSHDASAVTSGVFNVARIPAIAQSGVTGLIDALAGKAPSAHNHDASAVTSGVFNVARIPTIAQSGVTGLIDALGGKAPSAHNHDASAVISGVFNVARIPTIAQSGVAGLIDALSGKAPSLHSHDWSQVTGKGDVVLKSTTQLGVTGDAPLVKMNSYQDYGDVATGWTAMLTPDSAWSPGGYGYFMKTGRRDNGGGWGGIFVGRATDPNSKPDLWAGMAITREHQPYWTRLWSDDNFDPSSKAAAIHSHDWAQVTGKPSLALTDGTGIILGGPSVGVAVRVNGSDYRYLPEIASSAEVAAGVEGSRAVTPATLWSSARSISGSGYLQIPGTPLIMQWGVVTASASEGAVHVPLPVAFGGGCLVALATARNPAQGLGRDYTMQVVGRFLDRIAFFANRANDSAGNSQGFEWWALGLASGTPDPVYSAGSTGNPGGGGGGGETIEP